MMCRYLLGVLIAAALAALLAACTDRATVTGPTAVDLTPGARATQGSTIAIFDRVPR